jgi:hypothetical protein
MTKRQRSIIWPKQANRAPRIEQEICLLRIQVIELERRLKRNHGQAAFAEYRAVVAAEVERTLGPDSANVVPLRTESVQCDQDQEAG